VGLGTLERGPEREGEEEVKSNKKKSKRRETTTTEGKRDNIGRKRLGIGQKRPTRTASEETANVQLDDRVSVRSRQSQREGERKKNKVTGFIADRSKSCLENAKNPQ